MITLRRSADRGHSRTDWLDSRHSFSFGTYLDSEHVHFGPLRVLNEDHIQPGQGFGTHPHDNMEIITWMLAGSLVHEDSTGAGGRIDAGSAQRMTAGTGIRHSEVVPADSDPAHLLQIWIEPATTDLPPGHEQRAFDAADRRDRLALIAAENGRDGALTLHQDADIWAADLTGATPVELTLRQGRRLWVQVTDGRVTVNGLGAEAGDGVAVTDEAALVLEGTGNVLVFDLP